MRLRQVDQKVRFKLYKDGKQWVVAGIATGVAIPLALFSAAILTPMSSVQAASTDANYVYPTKNDPNEIKQAITDGTLTDVTPNGTTSMTFGNGQLNNIRTAGLKLVVNGNHWEILPASDKAKVDFNNVATQIGFPSADVLNNPLIGANTKTIMDFVANGIYSVNGGSATGMPGGMRNHLVSSNGVDIQGNSKLLTNSSTIGSSKYTGIVSGSLKNMQYDAGIADGPVLVADGGAIQGTSDMIPWSLTNGLAEYSFTDGSLSDEMRLLKTAVEKITSNFNVTGDAKSEPSIDHAAIFDFKNATKDAAGDYVFVMDSNAWRNVTDKNIHFTNTDQYQGGNVVILFKNGQPITFDDNASFNDGSSTSFLKNGHLFFATSGANTFSTKDVDTTNSMGKIAFLAPNSDIETSQGGFNGFIGAFNAGGTNGSITPGGDGYHKSQTGDPIFNTGTTTPGGDNTGKTDDKTPKTATINENFTYALSGADGIDAKYRPSLGTNLSKTLTATITDGVVSLDGDVAEAPQVKDGTYKNADGTEYTIFTDNGTQWARFTAADGAVYSYKIAVAYDSPDLTNASQVNAARANLKAGDKLDYGVHVTYTFDHATKTQKGQPVAVKTQKGQPLAVKTQVDEPISVKATKVQQTIHYRYADGVDGDPAALPKDTTETVNAIKDRGLRRG